MRQQSRLQCYATSAEIDDKKERKDMSDLVRCLCEGDHPVEVSLRPHKTVDAFKQGIDRGYIHIKFTDTRGGTELGVRLDRELTNIRHADFAQQVGRVTLIGGLTLDYVKVRCFAEIDLPSLEGRGR